MIKEYNNEDLNKLLEKDLWIIDFYATWCGPCNMLSTILGELAKDYNILKIDVDKHKEIAIKHGVMSIPTLIIYKDGKIIKETIGFKTLEELKKIIKES